MHVRFLRRSCRRGDSHQTTSKCHSTAYHTLEGKGVNWGGLFKYNRQNRRFLLTHDVAFGVPGSDCQLLRFTALAAHYSVSQIMPRCTVLGNFIRKVRQQSVPFIYISLQARRERFSHHALE
jgi:hypothetical protein